MAQLGVGTGIGLQGTPPIHGQYFNQRALAEQSRREAKIKRDDEAYQKTLEAVPIKPEVIDWKLQPLAQQAVADYAHQVTELRQKYPNTWENMVPQLKSDTMWKLANLKSSSEQFKKVRELAAKGEIHDSPELQKFLNTGQGDLKSNRPSALTNSLHGIHIDPDNYNVAFNPVKKVNIQKELQNAIYSQQNAWSDVIDPATGKAKLFDYGTEKRSRRAPGKEFVDSVYTSLTSNPDFAQNVTLAYLEQKRQQPGFSEEMVMDKNGQLSTMFLQEAENYGRNLARNTASQYYSQDQISQPAKTTINNNMGNGAGGSVSIVEEQKFNAGFGDGENRKVYQVGTPGQFTTSEFKAKTANSPTVKDLQTGKPINTPGVDKAVYAQFAVVPVYSEKGTNNDLKGIMISDENVAKNIDKENIEWKVVGIGTYDEGKDENGEVISKSIYRDADELLGAAYTPLSKEDAAEFKKNIAELERRAALLNKGSKNSDNYRENTSTPATTPKPTNTNVPAAGGTGFRIADLRKSNPGKSDTEIRAKAKEKGLKILD